MKTIWKYELALTSIQLIEIPKRAKVLCVQVQTGTPCIWVEVIVNRSKPVTTAQMEQKYFYIFATGAKIPEPDEGQDEFAYLGTFQLEGLVWHVYE